MPSVNQPNFETDQTVRIYDAFYDYSSNVPVLEYEAVLSYFQSIFASSYAAENFTASLFRVAEETNTSAMTLLQNFQVSGQSAPEINALMAYYLNSVRSSSTLLGIMTPTTPNYYSARNVRA